MQVFLDRNEANVTRISFLSKEDIQVYQMNVLLIVDNFMLTNKLPVTKKEYIHTESICAATNKVSVESDVEIDSPVSGYEIYQVDMVEEDSKWRML